VLIRPTLQETLLLLGAGGGAANTYSADFESTSSQYATAAAATGVNMTANQWTVEWWQNLESLPATSPGVCGQWSSHSTAAQSWIVYYDTSNNLNILCRNTTSILMGVKWTPSAGLTATWNHFAIVCDMTLTPSTGMFTLYENTVSAGSGTVTSGGVTTGSCKVVTQPLSIAGYGNGVGTYSYHLDGLLDSLRLWDGEARSGANIAAKWKTLLAGNETNLGACYQFENVWTDKTANNNDLTPANSPVFSSSVPFA